MQAKNKIPASMLWQVLCVAVTPVAFVGLVAYKNNQAKLAHSPIEATSSRGAISSESPVRPFHDVVRRDFRLEPGAHIDLHQIDGPVTISTADSDRATLAFSRSTYSQAALRTFKPRIVVSSHQVSIAGGPSNSKGITRETEVPCSVVLTLPRNINVSLDGINGDVTLNSFSGSLSLHHLNGTARIAPIDGAQEIAGVNGNINIRFADSRIANLHVSNVNGNVDVNLPRGIHPVYRLSGITGEVQTASLLSAQKFSAVLDQRTHPDGAPIRINGVNGNVSLNAPNRMRPALMNIAE